jgi:hypothetical protein
VQKLRAFGPANAILSRPIILIKKFSKKNFATTFHANDLTDNPLTIKT